MGKNIHVVSMDVEVTAVIRKDIIMLARKGNGRIIVIHSFVLFDKMADYTFNMAVKARECCINRYSD